MHSVHSQSTPQSCPCEKQSQYLALHLDLEHLHLNFFLVLMRSELIDKRLRIFPSSIWIKNKITEGDRVEVVESVDVGALE